MADVTALLVTSTLSRSRDGWRFQRDYLVDLGPGQLAGSPLYLATQQAGIPNHGDPDPEIPGIFALDFTVQLATEGATREVLVTVTFRRPEQGSQDSGDPGGGVTPSVTRVGARVSPATRTKDVSGAQIVTTHQASRVVNGETIQDELVTQPAEVEVLVPQTVLSLERRTSTDPEPDATAFVGKVNQQTFRGKPARSWLCTAIEGVSEDNGLTWDVVYEFELREATWDADVVYIDPETDRPPEVITSGVELRTYQVYELADFGQLML